MHPARPLVSAPLSPPSLVRAPGTLRLAELLAALSHALDLTEGQPAGHCVRCCYIGVAIGRELGLPADALADLYYTLLLKDLGCSSNAARICQLYLADDLTFKHDFKRINDSLPQALRFVLGHTGLKANLAERFRAVLNIVQNGGQIARELIETRCQRGAQIARMMRFSERVQAGIRDLDEHWDGGGKPEGLSGHRISLFARIALLAQVVDVFQTGGGPEAAMREVELRTGSWFDPEVAAAFERAAARSGFWNELASENVQAIVFGLEPAQLAQTVDEDYLDDIAIAFAQVVDAKSPYTHGHSERVALFTDLIAKEIGLGEDERRRLKRAALLHDIGKLGVSNQILDKAGKLDDDEWVAMRAHAAMSEAILSRIPAFDDLARVAGAHHERLDGKGYPHGLTAARIALETRIISTADVFDALTAERPYRGPMPVDKALSIMRGDADAALDGRCLAALERSLGQLDAR